MSASLEVQLAEARDELAGAREREARLRLVLEGIGDAFYVLDQDMRFLFASRAALALWDRGETEVVGRTLLETFPSAGDTDVYRAHLRVKDSGRAERFETRSPVLLRWIETDIYPTTAGGLSVALRDIEARKRAEAALRDSDERFRQFARASSDGLWIRDRETLALEYASPAMEAVYGVAVEALRCDPRIWSDLIIPEDRADALGFLEQVRRGEPVVHAFRIRRPGDRDIRWIRSTGFPLFDAQGRVQRLAGISSDITETRLAAEHQKVLLSELQHRVRNIMAMIRSITARTAEGAQDVDDYAALMAGRLLTLSRTQALLTRAANAGVEIGVLVREELEGQAHDAGQYVLDGPELVISPKAAEVLSLAIHELATNALKHGALAGPDGKVSVAWRGSSRTGRARYAWTGPRRGRPRPTGRRPPGGASAANWSSSACPTNWAGAASSRSAPRVRGPGSRFRCAPGPASWRPTARRGARPVGDCN